MQLKFSKAHACPRLRLELLTPRRSLFAVLTLVVGVMVALAAATHYFFVLKQIALAESRLASVTRIPMDVTINKSDKKMQIVQADIQRLTQPWDSLFMALEAASVEGIYLHSVEPETNGHIKLVGEAPDVYEMLTYWRSLAKQPLLKQVVLTDYSFNDHEAGDTVQFTIKAAWDGQYGR